MTKSDYIALVHKLPCVVDYLQQPREVWMLTLGRVHAHHLESVRHAMSDWGVVPLCPMHHQGSGGVHRLSRREFATRYKLDDVKMLEATIKLVIFYQEQFHGRLGASLVAAASPRAIFSRLQ